MSHFYCQASSVIGNVMIKLLESVELSGASSRYLCHSKNFFVLNQLEFSLTWLGLALQSAVLPKPLNYPRRLSHLEIPDCCCRFVIGAKDLDLIILTITFITAKDLIGLIIVTLPGSP